MDLVLVEVKRAKRIKRSFYSCDVVLYIGELDLKVKYHKTSNLHEAPIKNASIT